MNIDFITGVIIGGFFGAGISFFVSWIIAELHEGNGKHD